MTRLLCGCVVLCGLCAAACENDANAPTPPPPRAKVTIKNMESGKKTAAIETIGSPRGGAQPELQDRAEKVLDFYNRAAAAFETGYYALPEKIMENSRRYERGWIAPEKLEAPEPAKSLLPEKGLFNEAEEAALAAALDDMDKALARLLAHYEALLGYPPEARIEDEDQTGKRLQNDLELAHGQFMRARKTYMGIIDKAASEAESYILKTHPLERQIVCAREIFAQIAQISELLRIQEPDISLLASCRENMRELIDRASLPPFPAQPGLERLYRGFLKLATNYMERVPITPQTARNGAIKRELALLADDMRAAYNEFARQVNLGK